MEKKRKLRNWVKIALLLLPEMLIICQLFFIGRNIRNIDKPTVVIIESRCCYD